jgi:hypothetical protein
MVYLQKKLSHGEDGKEGVFSETALDLRLMNRI